MRVRRLHYLIVALLLVSFLSAHAGFAAPIDKAVKLYQKDRYDKAAASFWKILQESTQGSESYEAATYFLGQSLYSMGLHHAGVEYFYTTVRTAGNSEFIKGSLAAVKELVESKPFDSRLVIDDLIYGIEFAFLDEDIKDFIQFYQGLHNKRNGYERFAQNHFKLIRENTYYYYRVRYIEAVEMLKQERFDDAVKILEEIIAADFEDVDIKNRARQAIARLHYEKKNFEQALVSYSEIKTDLRKQASVFLERGWTNYFLKDFKSSLGSLHALGAPIYRGFFDAEKFVIRMLIYKEYCMYPATRAVLADYDKDFGKAVNDIKNREDLLKNERLLSALFWSFGIKQRYDFLKSIEDEGSKISGIRRWPTELKKHVQMLYDLKIKEIKQSLEADMLDGLQLVAEKLLDQNEQLSLLTYEVRLDELKRVKLFQSVNIKEEEKRPLSHGDHIFWPFDDEFWSDELQDYTYSIQNECKAEVIR